MSDGKGNGGITLRDAGKGARVSGGSSRHHRAPLPVDRSVLWTPSRDPGAPDAPAVSGPYELFLTRSVVQNVYRHLTDGGRDARFGFLLGELYRCPESGVHYAVCDRSIRSDEAFSEETPDPYLLRAWAESQSAFRDHGGILLGWYHSHYLLGLFLSEADREINTRYFAEPWQCCVLIVPDPSRPLGAVYRPSAAEEAGGDAPGPFRELLAPEDVPASGPILSAVGWTNYFADRDVAHLSADVDQDEAPAVVATDLDDAQVSSTMRLVLPENPPERHLPHLPVQGRRLLWVIAVVAMALGGWFGGKALFTSDSPPPAQVITPPDPTPARAPEVQRFLDSATDLQEAMLGYGERRQDFDLGRIGCELLAGGYASADDAFIGMAGAFAGLGSLTDDTLNSEYERLAEEMDTINVHFDGSGCPRPQ